MMYIILKNGQKVMSPPPSKCSLGLDMFMELAKQEGSTLVFMDLEYSSERLFFARGSDPYPNQGYSTAPSVRFENSRFRFEVPNGSPSSES